MKVSKTDAAFLAGTVTVAALDTIAVIPEATKLVDREVAEVKAELKQSKRIAPEDAFSAGLVVGIGIGAIGTVKVISDKLNNP